MTTEQRYASLDPNDAVQAGLLDDADIIVKSARFVLYDYNGKTEPGPVLQVSMEDADGKVHDSYYSAGKADRYVPSEDGTKLLLTGATALNASSNLVTFLKSLIDAGIKASFFSQDVSKLDGTRLHVNRVNQAARAGLAQEDNGKGPRTILLATKLIALPGEKPAAAAKGGTKAAAPTSAPAASAVTGELADKAVRYIAAAVAGGPIERKKISTVVFQAAQAAKDGDKSKLTSIVFDEKFLKENSGRPVEEGDGIVSFEYDADAKVLKAAA